MEVLLWLFQATIPPEDRAHWNEAARLAGQHKLPKPLLARLALAHADLVRSQHPEEAWADLAVAEALQSPNYLSELTRVKILESSGQFQEARQAGWKAILSMPDHDAQLRALLVSLRSGTPVSQAELRQIQPLLTHSDTQLQRQATYRARSLLDLPLPKVPEGPDWQVLRLLAQGRRRLRAKQWQPALQAFQQALELSLAHPHPLSNDIFRSARPGSLYNLIGQLEFTLNRYQQAERAFRQGVAGASSEEIGRAHV